VVVDTQELFMASVLGEFSFRLAATIITFAVLAGCVVPETTSRSAPPGNPRDGSQGAAVNLSFSSDDRRIVMDYYGAQVRAGKCPPGLAKKNNGCQPPGQAKKWQRGRPLPRDVAYYDLPPELSVRLRVPPPNHRYVQIAGDILMIAIGTSLVVDAIEDIFR
jgi:hypothetical protein